MGEAGKASPPEGCGRARLSTPAPPDGGWGWMVLLGAFVAYFIADGWSYTFGLFFPVFLHHFQEGRGHTAAIGAMVYGIPRLVSPLICAIINVCGCRCVAIFGGLITAVAFVMSAFATSIDYLCISIGLLASVGFATIYITSLVSVTFYFERRRGLATALAATGSGLGAFAFPPLMELCLDYYSWRGTLLLLGGICLHIMAAGALFRPPPLEYIDQDDPDAEDNEDKQVISTPFKCDSKPLCKEDPAPLSYNDIHNKMMPYVDLDLEGYGSKDDKSTLSHSVSALNKQLNSVISISSWSIATSMNNSPRLARRPRTQSQGQKDLTKHKAGHLTTDCMDVLLKNGQLQQDISSSLGTHNKGNESPKAPSCPDLHMTLVNQPSVEDTYTSLSYVGQNEGSHASRMFKKLCFDVRHLLSNICDKSLLFNKSYLLFCASSFVFYLFVVVPYVYLVDKVTLQGFSDGQSAMLLSIIGIGRTLGQIVLGCLGDVPKVNALLLYSVAIATTGIGTLVIPVCVNYISLCVSCAVFGFAVSVTYVLQMICVVSMVGLPKATNAFGMFQLIPGIATLMGTPITGLMYEARGDYDLSFYVAGTLIFLSGCVLLPLPFLNERSSKSRELAQETEVA